MPNDWQETLRYSPLERNKFISFIESDRNISPDWNFSIGITHQNEIVPPLWLLGFIRERGIKSYRSFTPYSHDISMIVYPT